MASKFTKGLRAKLWVCRIIDFLILVVPCLVYVIFAFVNGDIGNTKKIILTGLCAVAIIITIFNLFAQKHKRSPIWLVIIGLFIAIRELLMPLIIMLAVGSILDDFLFAPLISYYRTALISSKVYDKREEQNKVVEQAGD